LVGAVLLAVGGWYAWRWCTTPVPPEVSLERIDPIVAEAIREARKEVLDEPRSPAAWGKLGMTLLVHNFGTEAMECLTRAAELDPTDRRWPYFQGFCLLKVKPAEAVPYFRRAVELSDDDAIETRLRLAELLIELNRFQEAEPYFQQVYRLDEANPAANLNLGRLAVERGDYPGSLPYFRRAGERPETAKAAHLLLATVYMRLSREKEAARARDQAEKLPEDRPWFDPLRQQVDLLLKGKQRGLNDVSALLHMGQLKKAIAYLRNLAHDYPDDGWIHLALGMSLARQAQFAEAKESLRTAIRKSPGLLLPYFHLGALLGRDGEELLTRPGGRAAALRKFRAAVKLLRQAIHIKPDHGYSYHKLAVCYLHLGKEKEGLRAFRDAMRYQPEFPEGHAEFAAVLLRRGDDAPALRHLLKSLKLKGDAEPPRLLLALVLARSIIW
jgi:tetratricopeptide (TPR) repeat protein